MVVAVLFAGGLAVVIVVRAGVGIVDVVPGPVVLRASCQCLRAIAWVVTIGGRVNQAEIVCGHRVIGAIFLAGAGIGDVAPRLGGCFLDSERNGAPSC